MSKKISDFFKVEEKQSINGEVSSNKVRECRVILQDINKEFKKRSSQIEKSIQNCLKEKKTKSQVECQFCNKFLDKKNITKHIRTLHAKELKKLPFHCEICNLNFLNFKSLKKHTNLNHPNGLTENFECDYDGKLFGTKENLIQHMKSHLPKVKCKICNKMVQILSLNSHMNQTHATENKFQCKICSKLFKSKQILKYHEKTHDKKFQCDICKSKFTSKYQLDQHTINIHENPRSFACETCGNKFNKKEILKKHQKTHDKNRLKPFECQKCNYAADSKNRLRSHQKFHENLDKKIATMKNPQKCEKCPTICKDKRALKFHIIIVHPKNLYQCDLCGKYLKKKFL